jgi:hypothetical protein
MRILIAAIMKGAVNYHRLFSPHIMLKSAYPETEILTTVNQKSILNTDLSKVDIIIFTRVIAFEEIDIICHWLRKKAHCKLVLDIDDYWELDEHHILSHIYNKDYSDQVIKTFQNVDHIITTNKRLMKLIRPYNKRVSIIPNVINTEEMQWKSSPKRKGKVRFSFLGGETHFEDLQFAKCDFSKFDSVAYVDRYKELGFKIEKPKDEYTYGTLFDETDVSLAPLLPTKFNSCKSNLKVVEAGVKGKLICTTETPPYIDFKSENIVYFKPNESWQDKLQLLSKDRATVEKMAKGLQEEVLEYYNCHRWTKFRMDLYKSIL